MIKFKLYSSDGYGGERFPGGEGTWTLDSQPTLAFAMQYRPDMCFYLEADGAELREILSRFNNIPHMINRRVIWRKEWAQFIAENFKA